MSEIDIPISRQLWWTQNKRANTWAVPYQKKKQVKAAAYLTFRSLINSGKLKRPERWPVRVIVTTHPLGHGPSPDIDNASPMVKAILDALTQAEYWPDDNSKYLGELSYRMGEPSTEKGVYHITIRIEETA